MLEVNEDVLAEAQIHLAGAVREAPLTDRRALVLLLRFGLKGEDPKTLQEVGSILEPPVSRERVRQLVRLSIDRLRPGTKPLGPHTSNLVLIALDVVQPHRDGWPERLVEFGEALTGAAASAALVAGLVGLPWESDDAAAAQSRVRERRDQERRSILALEQAARRESDLMALLGRALWPSMKGETRPLGVDRAMRAPDDTGIGRSGSFWSLKRGRHVAFESSLEENLLRRLEDSPRVIYYQEQAPQIPVRAGGRRTYTPDVYLELDDDRRIVVEVKPIRNMGFAEQHAKWDAAMSWCESNGVGFLVTDGRHTDVGQIAAGNEPPGVREAIRSAIAVGGTWSAFRRASGSTRIRIRDLVGVALRGEVRLRSDPWALLPSATPGPFLRQLAERRARQ